MPTYATSIAEDGTILDAALASPSVAQERGWTLIPSGSGAGIGWRLADGGFVTPPGPEPTSADVDQERDRRIEAGFTHTGVNFQSRSGDRENIAGAAQLAFMAIIAGAQEGDLRWHGEDTDFVWIAEDNSLVPMDAHQVVALGRAAAAHKSALIFAARALKDHEPIPANYAANEHWS